MIGYYEIDSPEWIASAYCVCNKSWEVEYINA